MVKKKQIKFEKEIKEIALPPVEDLPRGIFHATSNPQVFIDHYGRIFCLEFSRRSGKSYLKQLTKALTED